MPVTSFGVGFGDLWDRGADVIVGYSVDFGMTDGVVFVSIRETKEKMGITLSPRFSHLGLCYRFTSITLKN